MVVTLRPATLDNGVTQERMALPSRWTVPAPHSAMPQPNLVPGKPATSRTAQSRGMLGSASSVAGLPLRSNEVDMNASAARWGYPCQRFYNGLLGSRRVTLTTSNPWRNSGNPLQDFP